MLAARFFVWLMLACTWFLLVGVLLDLRHAWRKGRLSCAEDVPVAFWFVILWVVVSTAGAVWFLLGG